MILVCNTGPLIALAKTNHLTLIERLAFRQVCIPPDVHKELWGRIGPETMAIEAALQNFIHVAAPKVGLTDSEQVLSQLDSGERQVLQLGLSITDSALLLLDDQAGRRTASSLGLSVIGTAGLLLLAKRRGLIPEVMPLLEAIRGNGYWLSDKLLEHVQQLAAEN